MKKTRKKGGFREGAGRPRIEQERQSKYSISLPESLAETAKQMGDGNLSAGIRKALRTYPKQ